MYPARHRAIVIGRYWGGLAGRSNRRPIPMRIGQGPPRYQTPEYDPKPWETYGPGPEPEPPPPPSPDIPKYDYQDYSHTVYGPPEETTPPEYQTYYPPQDTTPPEYQTYYPPQDSGPPPQVYEPPPTQEHYPPPVPPPITQVPGCPPVQEVCETSERRYHLGFSANNIAAGAQVIIAARPQYLVRFDRLIIPSNIGQFFDLNSITIGNVNQSVAAGANSGVVLSEVATYVELGLDTAYPGIDIELTVTNIDAQARNFRATFLGIVVA